MENNKNTITVKHFLNKRLKPKIARKQKYFPSYCQVTYKRHNTQFLFDWEEFYEFDLYPNRFTEKGFAAFESEEVKVIEKVNSLIEKAILFEEKRHKSRFNLKGFSKRLAFYCECFSCDFKFGIEDSIMKILTQEMTKRQYERLWEKLEWLSMLDTINYLEKIVENLREKINLDLWIEIHTYYLIDSFMEKYEEARSYDMWLFDNGFKKFEDYLSNETHLKKDNPFRKELQQLDLKPHSIYVKKIKEFIGKRLKIMEVENLS